VSHNIRRISPALAGAAAALLAGSAAAAVPGTGSFAGKATPEGHPSAGRVGIEVTRRHRAREASAKLHFTAKCEDGSSITRDVDVGRAPISHRGRFEMTNSSGGNFSANGQIAVFVELSGRFPARNHVLGTFRAGAIVTRDESAPSVSCRTGRVHWAGSR
jgi:hypothetical protein